MGNVVRVTPTPARPSFVVVQIAHIFGLFLDLRWVFFQGVSRLGEALPGGGRDLWPGIVDALTRARISALPLQLATVLRGVTDEGQWLRPALDLGTQRPHALCRRGPDAAAVLPGCAVTRDVTRLRRLRRCGKVGVTVHRTIIDGLHPTQLQGCIAKC